MIRKRVWKAPQDCNSKTGYREGVENRSLEMSGVGGGGGASLYGFYRYVWPQRVGLFLTKIGCRF